MACPDISVILENACANETGQETDQMQLRHFIAQSALNWAQANNPGVDYSMAAIEERMCESGVGKVTSEIVLQRYTAQVLCNLISG